MAHLLERTRWLLVGIISLACVIGTVPTHVYAAPRSVVDPVPVEEAVGAALQMALDESLVDSVELSAVSGGDVLHDGPGFAIEADLSEGVKLEVQLEKQGPDEADGGSELVSLGIEVLDGGQGEVRSGLIVADDAGDAAQTVVQPVEGGVRVMHVINDRSAPTEYVTRFSAEREISPVFVRTGEVFLHDAAGDYLGQLAAPWAVDAAGLAVQTSYAWEGGALVQRVDHQSGDYTYPIVADPEWSYSFNTMPSGYGVVGVTWTMAGQELRRCFNCSFPIAGAPRAYPKVGDIIRLNASPITLINIAAPVKVTGSGTGAFRFLAQKGHFDGEGSDIRFMFYHTCSSGIPTLRLSVNAKVVVDRGAATNAANAAVAKVQWQKFIDRTYNNTATQQGTRGRC